MPAAKTDSQASTLAAELRVLLSRLRRQLREQAETGDLTPSQIAAWRRLERHGPLTVSALARAEGVRSQSMGATVAVLEQAGLVERAADPNDGRRSLLSVSSASRAKAEANRAARHDWLTGRIEEELSAEERRALAQAITLLKRVVDG